VLIYMQPALQRRILRLFHYGLRPGGVLLLGFSESAGETPELFATLDRKSKIYVKQNVVVPPTFDVPSASSAESFALRRPFLPQPDPRSPRRLLTVQQLAERRLLDRYAPPGVLVDEDLTVLQFRGQTGPFLEPVPGAASLDLMKLVRTELVPPLRAAIAEARRTDAPATSVVRPGKGPEAAGLAIDVLPVPAEPGERRCFCVLFRTEPAPPASTDAAGQALSPDAVASGRIEAIQRELDATTASLQATIEDLEATNEELQSANEEWQSANEELQSTNEEIESSKEELQSTNEELATVNDELRNRMAQLNAMSDDQKNLLANMSGAILIVGADLRIRTFSAAAERLLNLVPTDVGRPVAYVRTVVMVREIDALVGQVVSGAGAREQRVRCTDGRWFVMRLAPYKTDDGAIRGALIEFAPAPAATRALAPGELGDLAVDVLAAVPQPLLVLDDQLRIFWVNRAFFERFEVDPDLFGRPLEEVWSGRVAEPELFTLLEDTAATGAVFSNVRVERAFGAAGGPVNISARRLSSAAGRPLVLVTLDEPQARGQSGGPEAKHGS
jgi:two-component system CheB/CheR fusion protein